MEPIGVSHPDLPALPAPPEKVHWWLVTPSPMSFENVGFSKPTHTGLPMLSSIARLLTLKQPRQTP
jgi:hypothetical protein